MKKVLTVILSLAILCSMSTTVFAYEEMGGYDMPYFGYGTSTLELTMYSSCDVVIPETIEVYNNAIQVISVERANIAPGHKVDICADNLNEDGGITLTHTILGDSYTLDCYIKNLETNSIITPSNNLIASVYDVDLEYSAKRTYFMWSVLVGTTAGDYTGQLMYDVSINPYTEEELIFHQEHPVYDP